MSVLSHFDIQQSEMIDFIMEKVNRRQQPDILHGSLWKALPQFAIPVATTAILEQLFNKKTAERSVAFLRHTRRFIGNIVFQPLQKNRAPRRAAELCFVRVLLEKSNCSFLQDHLNMLPFCCHSGHSWRKSLGITGLFPGCNHSHSTKTKQFRLCTFAFCLSHYFDFTIYLYYPVLKRPCYHFVIEVDNKNNFTVDNMEVVH